MSCWNLFMMFGQFIIQSLMKQCNLLSYTNYDLQGLQDEQCLKILEEEDSKAAIAISFTMVTQVDSNWLKWHDTLASGWIKGSRRFILSIIARKESFCVDLLEMIIL